VIERAKYHLAGLTDVLASVGSQIGGVSLNLFGVVTVTLKVPTPPAAPAQTATTPPASSSKPTCEKCGRS